MKHVEHPNLKIGDRVKVIDTGLQYTAYVNAFIFAKFTNIVQHEQLNKRGRSKNGIIFDIIYDGINILICLKMDDNIECLVRHHGVKLEKNPPKVYHNIKSKEKSGKSGSDNIFEIDALYKIANDDLIENNVMARSIGYSKDMLMDWFRENGYKFIKLK
jgi:hypothetical protein